MQHSKKWSDEHKQWIARVKTPDGKWIAKWLPKDLGKQQSIDADVLLRDWYLATYPLQGVLSSAPAATAKTIAVLAPRWLAFRCEDTVRTKPNTYGGLVNSTHNWILDNPKRQHFSIQNLDIETELTIAVIQAWIHSLKGSRGSRLKHINTLSTMIRDCILKEWLSKDFVSPFRKELIRDEIKHLNKSYKKEELRFTTTIDKDTAAILLTGKCIEGVINSKTKKPLIPFIPAYRRIRYLTALATGMRDCELQGLVWSDILFAEKVPYIYIQRQLAKTGAKPYNRYEVMRDAGLTRAQAFALPSALMTDPKYDEEREIVMHPSLIAALQWWRDIGWKEYTGKTRENDDPVFPNEEGGFAFSDSSDLLSIDLQRLGLPIDQADKKGKKHRIKFHTLRHAFDTLLRDAGVAEEHRRRFLGHGSGSTEGESYLADNIAFDAELIAKLPLPNVVSTCYASQQ